MPFALCINDCVKSKDVDSFSIDLVAPCARSVFRDGDHSVKIDSPRVWTDGTGSATFTTYDGTNYATYAGAPRSSSNLQRRAILDDVTVKCWLRGSSSSVESERNSERLRKSALIKSKAHLRPRPATSTSNRSSAPEPKSTVATLGAFGPPPAAAAATNASGAAPVQVLLSSVLVAAGGPANAQRVVAGMRAGFRNCYRRELADNPLAEGDVELTLSVDRQGAVSDVTEIHTGNLRTTARCMIARARAAAFDPPGKSPSVIRFRATLKSQGKDSVAPREG